MARLNKCLLAFVCATACGYECFSLSLSLSLSFSHTHALCKEREIGMEECVVICECEIARVVKMEKIGEQVFG